MGLIVAALVDAIGVVVFAAIGRRSHDEADGMGAVFVTAAPFLIALAVGWALVVTRRRSGSPPRNPVQIGGGVVIWAVTVVVGLVLRRTLWDRGTAAAFVIVAALFLGLVIVGWRGGYDRIRRSRPAAE